MGTNWQADKKESDRYIPHIKSLLGGFLIGEPPVEEDQERNTDLMVLKMEAVRVGCRIRTLDYLNRYPDDITIRMSRPSGNQTEMAKIIEGWGQYFFYGFGNPANDLVEAWTLIDLNKFRLHIATCLKRTSSLPGNRLTNHDGSSDFQVINLNDLPDNCIIHRQKYKQRGVAA